MKVEMRALDTIKPYEKNAKKHDQTQIDNVAESIKQYGFVQPIVVDKDGVIVIGHCRALGAKKLGQKRYIAIQTRPSTLVLFMKSLAFAAKEQTADSRLLY